MNTPCDCPLAGYCERHKIRKIGRLFELCQTRQDYFEMWESGRGPGQTDKAFKRLPKLGPQYNHWGPLHSYAVKHRYSWAVDKAQEWYRKWKLGIERTGCRCSKNWEDEVAELPPDFTSPEAFFGWTVEIHNLVNRRLCKTLQPTIEDAKIIWGFCD